MKEWFRKLFDGATDDVSSRRGVALISLFLVCIMAISHTLGTPIDADIYLGTIALVAAALGFTLYNHKKGKRNDSDRY